MHRGDHVDKVKPFRSLPSFVETQIRPLLATVSQTNALQTLAESGIDLEEVVERHLYEEYYESEIHPAELKLLPKCNRLSLEQIGPIQDLLIVDVREFESGQLLLKVGARSRCEFEVWMRISDALDLESLRQEPGYGVSWNEDDFTLRVISPLLQCHLDVAVDALATRTGNVQVLSIALEAKEEDIGTSDCWPSD